MKKNLLSRTTKAKAAQVVTDADADALYRERLLLMKTDRERNTTVTIRHLFKKAHNLRSFVDGLTLD